MQTIISGSAGLAFFYRGTSWFAASRDHDAARCSPSFVSQTLKQSYDAEYHADISIEDGLRKLEIEIERDQCLQILLIFLNPDEDLEIRQDAASELAVLLDGVGRDWLIQRSAVAIPREFDYLTGAAELSQDPKVADFIKVLRDILTSLDTSESALAQVVVAAEAANSPDESQLEGYLALARSSGLLSAVALGQINKQSANNYKIRALKVFSGLTNYRNVASEWLKAVLGDSARKKFDYSFHVDEAQDSTTTYRRRFARSSVLPPRRQMFDSVMRQQAVIVNLLQSGNAERAREFAEDLIQYQLRQPQTIYVVKTLCSLSQHARRLQLFDVQLDWARRATSFDSADAQAYGHLGSALLSNRLLADAERAFDRCLQMGDAVHALNGKARILNTRNRFDEALSLFRSAKQAYAQDPEDIMYSWVGEAAVLRSQGFLDDALAVYSETQSLYPGSPIPRYGLGAVLTDMGRIPEAVDHFDETLFLFPDNELNLSGKAKALREAGNFDEAYSIYEKVTEMYPTLSFGYYGQAEVLRAKGLFAEAEGIYRQAAGQFPTLSSPLLGIADTFRDQGRYNDALKQYDFAAKEFPDEIGPKVGAAATLKSSGNLEECLRRYDEIVQLHPTSAIALNGRADALRLIGKYDAALELYDRILSRQPMFRRAQHGRAALLSLMGRYDDVIDALPGLIADIKVREDWIGLNIACMAMLYAKKPLQARDLLLEACLRVPFARYKGMLQRSLALSQMEASLFHEAEQILRDASDPSVKVVWIHALCRSGNKEKAREVYRELRKDFAPVVSDLREIIAQGCDISETKPDSPISESDMLRVDCEVLLRAVAA